MNLSLSELKNKASMSELALIEKVETLIRKDVKKDLKEIVVGRLMDWTKRYSMSNSYDGYNNDMKKWVMDLVKVVEES